MGKASYLCQMKPRSLRSKLDFKFFNQMSPDVKKWQKELREVARPEKVKILSSFFKTGPGEYGEGDIFIGVTVPDNRSVARRYRDLPLGEILEMIKDPVHECRLSGLLALVARYKSRRDIFQRREIVEFYLNECAPRANNWDLVDLSAPYILGHWLTLNPSPTLLDRLSFSENIWEQRIAIVATHPLIRAGRPADTLRLAERYITHRHPLIHKAAGWMLREVGKHCGEELLRDFLDTHAPTMPRTMLSYAIERLDPETRAAYRAMPRL